MNMKMFSLIFVLIPFLPFKSLNIAHDANKISGFIILGIIAVIFFGGMIYVSLEESQNEKRYRKEEAAAKRKFNSPEEKHKRKIAAEVRAANARELLKEHKLFKENNPHLAKSKTNLKKSIDLLMKETPKCKKCGNKNFTLWDLHPTSLTFRCDSCKRKSLVNNEICNKIYLEFNNYLDWQNYCEGKNRNYTKFHFDFTDFRANTPIHRGIKFEGLALNQMTAKEHETEYKRSRRISQTKRIRFGIGTVVSVLIVALTKI